MLLAQILYNRAPLTYKFVQSGVAVDLWRQGCSKKAFDMLHKFGVTQGPSAARSNVDKVVEGFDNAILEIKRNVEVISREQS